MHYTNNDYNTIVINKYNTLSEIEHHLDYIYRKFDIMKYKCDKINDCEFTITVIFTHADKKYSLQNLVLELMLLEFSMNQIKELINKQTSIDESAFLIQKTKAQFNLLKLRGEKE